MDKTVGIVAAVIVVSILFASIGMYYLNSSHGNGTGNFWVKDDMGRKIYINGTVERIVSLAPSNTEILFAIGAGNKVVGVTDFCDYPPEAVERIKNGTIKSVGGFVNISVEKMVSLQPDVVFAYYGQEKIIEELDNLSIPTVVFNPKNIDMIYNDILIAGKVTGFEENARTLVNEMKNRVNEITSKVKDLQRKRVFFIVWGNPLMTAGSDTFINQLIELAGGENIFDDLSGWPSINIESVMERNPDIIILTPYCGITAQDILNNWSREINAVKNESVYTIEDLNILIRPGPRIVEGLETLAKIIHPEALETKGYLCRAMVEA